MSWNLGKIPFQTGNERFKTNYREYFKPGPGHYVHETGEALAKGGSGFLGVSGMGANLSSPK